MRASGLSGELRVGHRQAATLGRWTIESNDSSFVLRASVFRFDEFWVYERPIDVALRIAGVEWVWRQASVQFDGREIVSAIRERPLVEQPKEKTFF